MNVINLKVSGSLPGEVTFTSRRELEAAFEGTTELDLTLDELTAEPSRLDEVIPSHLRREIQQWVLDDPEPGLLAISVGEKLDGIPWEQLPWLLDLPTVFVARLLDEPWPILDRHVQEPLRLLAAGWSGRPLLRLPGIQQELNALKQLGSANAVSVQVLFEPKLAELAAAYGSSEPDVLHLVPPALHSENGMPTMALSGAEELEWIRIDEFVSRLPMDLRPRLAVLNSCSGGASVSGLSATRVLTEILGSVTVGWLGEINDLAAVDFALFFYSRLLEGGTVIDALRAYRSTQPYGPAVEQAARDLRPRRPRPRRYPPTPMVWASSLAQLAEPLQARRDEGTHPVVEHERQERVWSPTLRDTLSTAAEEPSVPLVEVTFEPQKWLNPAMLKNRWPAIGRLTLAPDRALRNVGLAITCDTGSGTSMFRQTLNLSKGSQPIRIDNLQFPVLYELIQAAVPRRHINFTVTCSHLGAVLVETTQSVLWMGLTEWLDKPDTWRFIPAFVDPYADGVLDVIDEADGVLKKIVGPTSDFCGYQSGDRDFVMKQTRAIFDSLRDDPFRLKYINPPPIPVYTPGDRFASGQRVRPPDEVIGRHRGTCHDLAVLFASCLEHIGIFPLILLIQGHTFVGFWKNKDAHGDFWLQARDDIMRLPQIPGREWMIADLRELRKLEREDSVCFVEATLVTNRNAEFEDAIAEGHNNLKRRADPSDWFNVAIDIQASRFGIQPL
jgi:hypothetical protein